MKQQRPPTPSDFQLKMLRKHLARKPQDGRGWLMLAQMLSSGPPGKELHNAVERSVKLLPDDYQAWLLAAKLHQHMHGAGAALAWLENIIQQNPGIAAPQLANASLRASSDPSGAHAQYEKIISVFPQDDRALVLLAGLQKNRGDFGDAGRCLERALKITPGSAKYWGMLAEINFRQGRPDAAVKAASHSLQLDSKQSVALGIRAESYRQSGLWVEALSDFRQLEKHQPESPQLANKIGVCLIRLGRYETAAEQFDKALRLDPGFSMARFNIGLLCAIQMKGEEAISRISEALEDPAIDDVTRQSGLTTLDVLAEHRRLKPFLEQAGYTGAVSELNTALEDTPVALLQENQQCADDLWELATLCRDLEFDPEEFSYTADTQYLPFIEACIVCKLDSDVASLASLYTNLTENSKEPLRIENGHKIMKAWDLVRDRQNRGADQLQQKEGEAWLRYWHARLVSDTPEILPGQYKAIENTIGVRNGKIQTPPEAVAAIFRLLLADIRPSVPDGPARAMFMYIAMCMIHGFADGNGRLGRFMLAWETESAGMPALIVPLSLREELILSLGVVLVENDPGPMFKLLKKAYAETNRLLQQFNTIMADVT